MSDAFGTNRSTVSRWVNRFQQEGNQGLMRRAVSGRPRKLEELTKNELCNIVLQPASKFGYESDLWTKDEHKKVSTKSCLEPFDDNLE